MIMMCVVGSSLSGLVDTKLGCLNRNVEQLSTQPLFLHSNSSLNWSASWLSDELEYGACHFEGANLAALSSISVELMIICS